MADSLATEAWRDGNWMRLLSPTDSCGYDQHGAMLGQIFIGSSDKEEFEMNLPGMRQRRWGLANVPHLRRTGSILGVCKDGMVVNLGANSFTHGLTQ